MFTKNEIMNKIATLQAEAEAVPFTDEIIEKVRSAVMDATIAADIQDFMSSVYNELDSLGLSYDASEVYEALEAYAYECALYITAEQCAEAVDAVLELLLDVAEVDANAVDKAVDKIEFNLYSYSSDRYFFKDVRRMVLDNSIPLAEGSIVDVKDGSVYSVYNKEVVPLYVYFNELIELYVYNALAKKNATLDDADEVIAAVEGAKKALSTVGLEYKADAVDALEITTGLEADTLSYLLELDDEAVAGLPALWIFKAVV